MSAETMPVKAMPAVEIGRDESVDELVARYGEPVYLDPKGDPHSINQMYFAARYVIDRLVLFSPEEKLLFQYDPDTGLWTPKTEAAAICEMGSLHSALLRELGAESLICKRTGGLLGQVLRFVKGISERMAAFRKEKAMIHVANGVLDLSTDPPQFLPFSHEHMSRNRSEIPYEPDATCPRFLAELLGPALDADDISLLQRIAGQCLIGVNLAQKILLMRGTAGGGKSTIVSILEQIIGIYNVANVRVTHMEGRFEMAGYLGKTLLTGKDVRSDFLDSEAAYTLKPLVGGDHLEAEKKNGRHRVGFVGEFNVIITANSRLTVNLDSDVEAWRRRLLAIDYVNPPPAKPSPNFASELVKEEGPGILNWCIEGAMQLLAELKEFGKMQLTDAQRRRVDDLLDESDSVRQFAGLQLANERGGSVTVAELQVAYVDFCMGRGWQPRPAHQFDRSIAKVMLELHRSPKRTDIKRDDRNQRGFANVTLRTAEAEAAL